VRPIYQYHIFDLQGAMIPRMEECMRRIAGALEAVGLTIRKETSCQFESPEAGIDAFTGLWVLAESHAVVHTAPEHEWVEIVVASCRTIDPKLFTLFVKRAFKPAKIHHKSFEMTPAGERRGQCLRKLPERRQAGGSCDDRESAGID